MFPEITRDEVFRIETPRLWLRWPVLADAEALATVMAGQCQDAEFRLSFPQAFEPVVKRWRDDMEAGRALHLVVVPKSGARAPVGLLHALPTEAVRVEPDSRLGTIGAEARRALSAMLALLGLDPAQIPAPAFRPALHSLVVNAGPARACLHPGP